MFLPQRHPYCLGILTVLFTTVLLSQVLHPPGCTPAPLAAFLLPLLSSSCPILGVQIPILFAPLSVYLLLSMMVWRRWAIVRTVQSANSLRIVVWIKLSVSKSTAAVASSRMRILALRSKARARHTNCLCPTLGGDEEHELLD